MRHDKINGLLAKLAAELSGDKGNDRKASKVIMAKPEWVKLHNEADEMAKTMEAMARKLEHLHRKFWSVIEEDLDTYQDMRWNDSLKAVEILETDDEYAQRKEKESSKGLAEEDD